MFRFIALLSVVSLSPFASANMGGHAGLPAKCETFLDRAAKRIGLSVPPVLSHLNVASLRMYTPQPQHQNSSYEQTAYGNPPSEIMEKLPNFAGESVVVSSSEIEDLRADLVSNMIKQLLPDWRQEKIWFFEAAQDLHLFKENETHPIKFEAGSFVILRGGYAIGRANLGEIDTIEWL